VKIKMKGMLCVLVCLLLGTALSMLTMAGCSPPPSDSLSLLIPTSTGTKENFQAELLSGYPDNDYVNNSQTWCYNVTVLAEEGDLSHWCLDLCDEPTKHKIVSWSGPAEKIEYTDPKWDDGNHGHIIKWDGTALKPGESAIFCFTLEHVWESIQIEWFAKNGALWGSEEPKFADTGWVTGPSCLPPCVLPNADFLADKNEVCAGSEIIFTDISTPDDITTWSWSFPEGNPSSADTQGPHAVTYDDPGVCTVSLNVSNSCGSHTESKTNYITVKDCTPAPLTLNLTINSGEGGSVTARINPTIVVGPGNTTTIHDIPVGTVVNLTASPATAHQFVNWTGAPIDGVTDAVTVITMLDNYVITANFKAVAVIPPVTVGWEVYPINKTLILMPWIIPSLFIAIVSGTVLLTRRY
jgi:PKD repeat protein